MIIAVFILSVIEKWLHKKVPAMFDLFVTPLVSVFVTGYLTLSIVGPVFTGVENAILDGVQHLITLPYGIGSFLMGAAYAATVVAGVHHMYTIIDMGQLAKYGLTYWLPLASAANLAQGGAALAVALKTKAEIYGSSLCAERFYGDYGTGDIRSKLKIWQTFSDCFCWSCLWCPVCLCGWPGSDRNRGNRNFRCAALPEQSVELSDHDGSIGGSFLCADLAVWL